MIAFEPASRLNVLIAGGLVYLTPDIVVGLIIATWFFRSAWPILRESLNALKVS